MEAPSLLKKAEEPTENNLEDTICTVDTIITNNDSSKIDTDSSEETSFIQDTAVDSIANAVFHISETKDTNSDSIVTVPLVKENIKDTVRNAIKDSIVTKKLFPANSSNDTTTNNSLASDLIPQIKDSGIIVVKKAQKKGIKQGVSKPRVITQAKDTIHEVDTVADNLVSEFSCFSLTGKALTTQEAFECSNYHWKQSLETANVDSSFLYCNKALSLYENGSLFTQKARLLNKKKRYSEAVQATEISISRFDHWKQSDKTDAYRIRLEALKAIDNLYPSAQAKNNILKAEKEYNLWRSN